MPGLLIQEIEQELEELKNLLDDKGRIRIKDLKNITN